MSAKKNGLCTGHDKIVEKAKDLHPITLYHTTVNIDRVCNEGLKSIDAQEPKHRKSGIGGGHDRIISFTYDKNYAYSIAQDMKTLSKIANNILTPNNICEYLNKVDTTPNLKKSPCEILSNLRKGEGFDPVMFGYDGVFEDLKKNRLRIRLDKEIFEKIDVETRQEGLFNLLKQSYFFFRRANGGKQDPVFWGTNLYKNYKQIKPDSIGIVKVLGFSPHPKEYYERESKYNNHIEEYYPNKIDKIQYITAEKEVRMNPKYTTKLEIAPFSPKE